jgi:hypothetical protein
MQIKWLVFFTMLFMFGSVFSSMLEADMFGEQASGFGGMMNMETYTILGFTIPRPSMEWVNLIAEALMWDYNFFKDPDGTPNGWALLRWLLLFPISLGMITMFAITFIPMLLDGAKTLRNMLPI